MSHGRSYVAINGTNIRSCTSRGVDRRQRAWSAGLSGTLHRTMHNIIRTAPIMSFTALDIDALLGVLNNVETPMVELNGTTGMRMVWPKGKTDGPGDQSGSVHHSETMLSGSVYLDEISCSSGSPIEASCTAFGKNALGTTDPVQDSDSAALPTAVFPEVAFSTTGFSVDGDEVLEDASWRLRIAHGARNDDEAHCYLHGKPHPTQVLHPGAGGQIAMEFEFETGSLASFGLGTIIITMQAQASGGIGTSGTTRTLTLIPGLLIPGGPVDGDPSRRTWRCPLRHDGTNRPLTIS